MSKPDWTESPDDATHWDTVRDFFAATQGTGIKAFCSMLITTLIGTPTATRHAL